MGRLKTAASMLGARTIGTLFIGWQRNSSIRRSAAAQEKKLNFSVKKIASGR